MSDTIYWAIKLDDNSVGDLLAAYPPIHSKVYAEHMTIAFRPSPEIEEQLMSRKGERVTLMVISHTSDDKGQAVVVDGFKRADYGVPHITISCADGVSPKYSNELIGKDMISDARGKLSLMGRVARFTPKGWDDEVLEEDISEGGDSGKVRES